MISSVKKAWEISFDGESMEQLWKDFLMLSISRCSLVAKRFANEFSRPRLSMCGFGLWMNLEKQHYSVLIIFHAPVRTAFTCTYALFVYARAVSVMKLWREVSCRTNNSGFCNSLVFFVHIKCSWIYICLSITKAFFFIMNIKNERM